MRLAGDRCQCPPCSLYFNSTAAFDKHRTDNFGKDHGKHAGTSLTQSIQINTMFNTYSTEDLFSLFSHAGIDPNEITNGRAFPSQLESKYALPLMEMVAKVLLAQNDLLKAENEVLETERRLFELKLEAARSEIYAAVLAAWETDDTTAQ